MNAQWSTALCTALMLSMPAMAQRNDSQRHQYQEREDFRQRERDGFSQRQERDEFSSPGHDSFREQQERDSEAPPERGRARQSMDYEGWARIAYDLDQDGSWDAYEYIHMFDLDEARRSSRDRQSRDRGARYSRDAGQGEPQVERVSGTLHDLYTVELRDEGEPHLIARIRTSSGRAAKVDLGPASGLERLGLSEGDRVRVQGVSGTIDDRFMLIATRIEFGDHVMRVDRSPRRSLSRIRGEIVSTRGAEFEGHNHTHVLARVRLDGGRVIHVDLGPQHELREIDLASGDQISVLGRPARINGQAAYIAHELRVEDQSVEIRDAQQSGRDAAGRGGY